MRCTNQHQQRPLPTPSQSTLTSLLSPSAILLSPYCPRPHPPITVLPPTLVHHAPSSHPRPLRPPRGPRQHPCGAAHSQDERRHVHRHHPIAVDATLVKATVDKRSLLEPNPKMNDAMFTEHHPIAVDATVIQASADKRSLLGVDPTMNDAMFTSHHPIAVDATVVQASVDRRTLLGVDPTMNDAMFTSHHPIAVDATVAKASVDRRNPLSPDNMRMNDAMYTNPHHALVGVPIMAEIPILGASKSMGERQVPGADDFVDVDRLRMEDSTFTSPHHVDESVPLVHVTVDKRAPLIPINDALWTSSHPVAVEAPITEGLMGKRQEAQEAGAAYRDSDGPTRNGEEYDPTSPGHPEDDENRAAADRDYPGQSYAYSSDEDEEKKAEKGGVRGHREKRQECADSGDEYARQNGYYENQDESCARRR